jgi:uronate dehydrogenase
MAPTPSYRRILLTGAAGGLGRVLRGRARVFAPVLRVSDIAELGAAREGEEVAYCNLANPAGVEALVAGTDAILHFGGISVEGPFEPILQANIAGVFNLYEAARKHGVRRIVYASSNHVTGFYPVDERVAPEDPMRPDGLYGVSKCFGENLSRFYFDRYGIETVCLRIGSCFPEPRDRRMLATWLSYDDLVQLVRCALFAPSPGHLVVYGVSGNATTWWEDANARAIGFQPRDSSEPARAKVEAAQPAPRDDDPAARYQGGSFVTAGPFE